MKKICLLFACVGLIAFTAKAQEIKKTKDPVRISTAERPAPAQPQPVKVSPNSKAPVSEPAPTAQKVEPAKNQSLKYKRINAVAVPVSKAGPAK